MDHGGRDGGQGVVVAELDLGDGEGVVFVDDGDDAHLKELVDRVDRIEVLGSLWGLYQVCRRMTCEDGGHTSAMSFRVRRIWAMGCRSWSNSLSHRLMSLHCPMAARAWRYVRDAVICLWALWDGPERGVDALAVF